jgi:hypothetical protein
MSDGIEEGNMYGKEGCIPSARVPDVSEKGMIFLHRQFLPYGSVLVNVFVQQH